MRAMRDQAGHSGVGYDCPSRQPQSAFRQCGAPSADGDGAKDARPFGRASLIKRSAAGAGRDSAAACAYGLGYGLGGSREGGGTGGQQHEGRNGEGAFHVSISALIE